MADIPLDPPPIQHAIANRHDLKTPLPWALWFEKISGVAGGGGAPSFGVVAVPDADNVVALIPTDTLTLNAGPGIALETNALAKSVLIRSTASAEPAPPDTSVQFNDAGAFGGNEAFEFKKDVTTVTIGTGHDWGTTGSANLLVGEGHRVL